MKRTIKKRLTLNRDTVKALVELSSAEIRYVQGGGLDPGPVQPHSGGSGTTTLVGQGVC